MILWALDYEMLVTVCVAVAGVCIVVLESRAHRRETAERIALHERLTHVEACIAAGSPLSISERVTAIESCVELAQRVTALECRPKPRPKTTK